VMKEAVSSSETSVLTRTQKTPFFISLHNLHKNNHDFRSRPFGGGAVLYSHKPSSSFISIIFGTIIASKLGQTSFIIQPWSNSALY
jgi:lipoate-protein ligase A